MENALNENVCLTHGAMSVVISPKLGGTILSFQSLDQNGERIDWLRATQANEQREPKAFQTGCFPLFPFSNRIADDRLLFEQQEYPLLSNLPGSFMIHGHSWMGAWRVTEQSTSSLSIVFDMPHQDVASHGWPFSYLAEQRFELSEQGLKVTLKLTNTSTQTMPAGMGLHPYFNWLEGMQVTAKCQGMWLGSAKNIPVQEDFSHQAITALAQGELLKGLDNNFTQWDGLARIEWPDSKACMTIKASDMFRHLVVYSPEGEDYFCLEPVSHVTNAFNHPEWSDAQGGMQILSPNETIQGDIRFLVK